jgi:hypothetical protein
MSEGNSGSGMEKIESVRDILDSVQMEKSNAMRDLDSDSISNGSGNSNSGGSPDEIKGSPSSAARIKKPCRWSPTSVELLEESETRILSSNFISLILSIHCKIN